MHFNASMQALVNTSFLGALQQAWKFWHMTFHDWGHLSTLPFWGRYSKPENLTYDVPWLGALVNTSILGRYSKPEKLTYDVPWLQDIAGTCQHFHVFSPKLSFTPAQVPCPFPFPVLLAKTKNWNVNVTILAPTRWPSAQGHWVQQQRWHGSWWLARKPRWHPNAKKLGDLGASCHFMWFVIVWPKVRPC